jgi:hypothetical protein
MVNASYPQPYGRMIMRISNDAKELAKLKYIRGAQEISSKHYANIERFERTMPRGGMMKGAIDKEHLQMIQELADLYLEAHLEMFVAEGILPDTNDMREFRAEIENIVSRRSGGEFWSPRPSTNSTLSFLPQSIYINFANRVKQMELEARVHKAAPEQPASTSYNTTIHGPNYGNIQQGGQGNTQSVTRAGSEEEGDEEN